MMLQARLFDEAARGDSWFMRARGFVASCGVVTLASGCWVDSRFEHVPESVCASREIWTYMDKDSPLMNPGRSCVGCHADLNDPVHAPLYTVGGTVMQAPHEDDDCRGSAGMSVILTDAEGTEWNMTGNSAGNFWLDADVVVVMPYTARIIDAGGNERIKQSPVSEGDCASCHTRDGANGASGRLVPPDALVSPNTP
jgi:hypothetical protein